MSTALRRVRKYFISSQVYEALRPLFFLTFLYGLTPFHVVRRKMGESYLKMSCFGIFNIFVYIVLCGFCYISSLRQGESIVGYFFRTEISTVGDRLQIFNGLIAGAVIYTSAILKRCKLLGTLTILHSLDTNFSNIGIRVKYSRIFRYSILLLVFKLLILGVYFVGVFRLLVSLGVTPSFCVCMTFFLQHSVVSIAICLFCVIAFSFERRLSIVNQVNNENETQRMDVEKDTNMEIELPHPLRRRWRRLLSAKQLYEALRPLFFVTHLYGLTSFYICRNNETGQKEIKKSWFSWINGILHIVLYGVSYIITIFNNCESVASYFFRSRITYLGDMLQITSGLIGVTVIYLTAILPKHRLEECLQKFHTMDLQLHSVGIKIMYSKVLRFSYAIMISMLFVNFSFSWGTFGLLHSSDVSPSLALHFTFMIQHTVIAIAVTMFACCTYLVEMRLVMVNKSLGKSVFFEFVMWPIWRELFRPRDAYGAEQTLLLFTYLLGLTPFLLRGETGARHFQLSRLGYLNALLQLSFFGYCFLTALIEEESIVGYFFKSPISQAGDSLQKFIGLVGMFTLFLCCGLQVRLLIELFDLVAHIDDRLLNLGVCFNYPRIMRLRHTQLILISIIQLGYLISSICMLLLNDVQPIYTATVAFYVPQVFLLSIVVLFAAILHRCWQHFTALNKVRDNIKVDVE
ncbi:hypothetical protein ACLKA7_003174 [Drosophila subpalustris]